MMYLKAVKEVSQRDRIKNEEVEDELGVEQILESIERQKVKWFMLMIKIKVETTTREARENKR